MCEPKQPHEETMTLLPMKKELAVERDDDRDKKEETSANGSATSSVHSDLTSRMETQKQPFDSSCKFKKQKQVSLFDEIIVPVKGKNESNAEQGRQALNLRYNNKPPTSEICFSLRSKLSEAPKKETVKRENLNLYDKEINTQEKPLDFFAYAAKEEKKQASSSAKVIIMPMKRKTPEQEAEEENQVSIDLTLTLGYQGKKKRQRTSDEIILSLRAYKEVSAKLTLFDETWPIPDMQATRPFVKNLTKADMKERAVVSKIAAMKNYKPGEEQAERRRGVSTKLGLRFDPWNIKKKLTLSDLGHLSRLLLNTSLVEKYVLPFMNVDIVNLVESTAGLRVKVWDCDTGSLHPIIFKKWSTSKSYILNGRWVQDFVKRRNLKEGDEIGLYWDSFYSRFNFSILDRAPTIQLATADGTSISGSRNR